MCMRWNQELHKHHAFDRGLAFCVKDTRMTVQCNPKKAPTVESMERASTNKYLDSRSSKNRVFTEERAIPTRFLSTKAPYLLSTIYSICSYLMFASRAINHKRKPTHERLF